MPPPPAAIERRRPTKAAIKDLAAAHQPTRDSNADTITPESATVQQLLSGLLDLLESG